MQKTRRVGIELDAQTAKLVDVVEGSKVDTPRRAASSKAFMTASSGTK
jgi:hypothetical protein